MRRAGAALALVLLLGAGQASADGIEDFYRGKQISLIISAGTGGGYNQYAQALGQFFGNHLAGHPTVVPQFMPGAGGIRAANFLYSVAPKDGATLGFVYSTITTADVFAPEQAHFESARINWIGNMDAEPAMCVFWHGSGGDSLAALKTREFTVGSPGVGGDFDQEARILNRIAGSKLKIIAGYNNGNEVNLAMERREIDGRCGWSPESIEATRPDWLAEKKIDLLVQFGLAKHPRYADVPLILDLVGNAEDKAALELVMAERDFQRPILAPPGVPADRVAALRQAFLETMADPAFLADIAKRKLSVSVTSGAAMQATIERLHAVPASVVQRAIALIGE